MYIEFNKESKNKSPKFKVGDHVRISKYKSNLAKAYFSNWSEEFFVIKIVKNSVRGHILLVILKAKKLLKRLTKKNCKEKIKQSLELQK